jgi:hypothetical protein
MLMAFLTSRELLGVDALPKQQKYNQRDFVQNMIPKLQSERSRFACQKTRPNFPRSCTIQSAAMAPK